MDTPDSASSQSALQQESPASSPPVSPTDKAEVEELCRIIARILVRVESNPLPQKPEGEAA